MIRILVSMFVILFVASCEQSSPLRLSETAADTIAALEKALPDLMRKNNVSGIGIAVIRDDQTTLVKSFGIADQTTHNPINSGTVFEVASLGKPVFSYLVIKLAHEGLFNLDEPLVKYMPDLFSDPDPRLRTITARMILSHSSGLPNFGTERPEKILFEPGSSYQYSGIGFEKLQLVLETLSGKSLNETAMTTIFEPFGMTSTSYVWDEKFHSRLAKGHGAKGSPIVQTRKPKLGNAAWSLYSSTADYARFVERLMNPNDAIATEMYAPQIEITDEISWGLGWSLQETMPHRSFWHWGSNPGYRGYIVGYPSEGIAVIILSNSDTMFKMVEDIVKITIGGSLPSYHWF